MILRKKSKKENKNLEELDLYKVKSLAMDRWKDTNVYTLGPSARKTMYVLSQDTIRQIIIL